MKLETEVIDKLFLELSQVTKATTHKEHTYRKILWECYRAFEGLDTGEFKVEHVASAYKNKIYSILHTE